MKKMTRTGLTSYNGAPVIVTIYLILMVSLMAITFNHFPLMVMSGIVTMIGMFMHLSHNARVIDKRFYGSVSEHVWVIDWGPYGRFGAAKLLPEGLREYAVFVPGKYVRSTSMDVLKNIIEAGNPLFQGKPGESKLEVKTIWFARGKHVEERWKPKAYKKRLIQTMSSAIVGFHAVADTPDSNIVIPGRYEEVYIESGLNLPVT